MWNSICLMLPTYKRTDKLLPKFISSSIITADDKTNLKYAFCINQNDLQTKKFLENYPFPNKKNVLIIKENLPKPHLGVYFNMLYREVVKTFGKDIVVTMMGDDMEFLTKGWDTKILEKINEKNGIGVFWCNDDYIGKDKTPINLQVTPKMVELTEAPFMDETYPADMIDVIWGEIGKSLNIAYYSDDIIIRHNHSMKLPHNKWDETFRRLKEQQIVAHHVIGKNKLFEIAKRISERLRKKGVHAL